MLTYKSDKLCFIGLLWFTFLKLGIIVRGQEKHISEVTVYDLGTIQLFSNNYDLNIYLFCYAFSHPRYPTETVAPKPGKNLGGIPLKGSLSGPSAEVLRQQVPDKPRSLQHSRVIPMYTFTAGASQRQPSSPIPSPWPQETSHAVKKALKALAAGMN